MKKLYFLFIILFITTAVSYGQVDSLRIIPKNPTTIDSVRVIAYTTFGSGGCDMINVKVTMPGGNWIYVDACHDSGPLAVICHTTDTVNLGLLTAGKYDLGYMVRRVNPATDPTDCTGQTMLDSMNTSFTVAASSGIGNINAPKNTVLLFPNPSNGAVAIHYELDRPEENAQLVIYNIVGQVVKKVALENKKGAIVENISHLSKGSYFYRIETPSYTGVVDRLNIIE